MQLKFSNPIRDYCHLLSNRLIFKLLKLRELTAEGKELLTSLEPDVAAFSNLIVMLRACTFEVVAQLGKQLTYQRELRFIMQSDQKMKTAERDINRCDYAFQMLKDAGYDFSVEPALGPQEGAGEEAKVLELPHFKSLEGRRERVLISNVNRDRYEGWHPTLGEFNLFVPKP